MTWWNLPLYSPGEIIPSAWANNMRDNFSHVDTRTGGDPGSGPVGRFLVSTGALGGGWRLLQAGDFGAAIIPDSALANNKVNRINPQAATFAAALGYQSGFVEVLPNAADQPVATSNFWHLIQSRHTNQANDYRVQLAFDFGNLANAYIRTIINGSPTAWQRLWHAGNISPLAKNQSDTMTGDLTLQRPGVSSTGYVYFGNSGLRYFGFDGTQMVANTPNGMLVTGDVRTYRASNATVGYVLLGAGSTSIGFDGTYIVLSGPSYINGPLLVAGSVTASGQLISTATTGAPLSVSSAVVVPSLNADLHDGYHAGNASGQIPVSNGVVNANLVAASATNATNATTATNANQLGGVAPSGYALAGHTHAAGPTEPSGIIVLWDAASPPAGYTIYGPTAGRFVAGVGGAFSLGGTGGASTHGHDLQGHVHDYNHAHGSPPHTHNATNLGVGGTTGGPVGTGTGGGTGATFADGSHHHDAGGLDVTGSTDPTAVSVANLGASPINTGGPSTNATSTVSNLPPYIGLHYIKKS